MSNSSNSNQSNLDIVKKFALRAAIAGVMSRNLAHNTGSHKAPWLKYYIQNRFQKIEDFIRTFDSNSLPTELKTIHEYEKQISKADTEEEKNSIREKYDFKNEEDILFLIKTNLAYFFDFLNDNMEFIADVTTSFEASRFNFAYTVNELIQGFAEEELSKQGLIDNFSFFDEYSRKKPISISYNNKSGGFREQLINLPNGQLGKTAFAILFENIVRNFFKHEKFDGEIKIWFKFSSHDEGYIKVDVVGEYLGTSSRKSEIIDKINKTINEPILNDDLSIRQEAWGVFEMKVCAAYLVDYPLEEIDNKIEREGKILTSKGEFLTLLKANFYKIEADGLEIDETHPNLGYRFYIARPKKIYIDEDLIKGVEFTSSEGIKSGALNNNTKSIFSQYEIIVCPEYKTHFIDQNQRKLVINDNKYTFEWTDKKEDLTLVKSKFIFNTWFQKILGKNKKDLEKNKKENLYELIFENYLNQNEEFKVKFYDFSVIDNENMLTKLREKKQRVKPKEIVIIDSHGGDVISIGPKNFENLKSYLWYIPEDNHVKSTWLNRLKKDIELTYSPTGRENKLLLTELINVKVSIFDERLQQDASFEYRNMKDMTISQILSLCGILIPAYSDIDLTKVNDENAANLINKIKESLNDNQYTILHYSIFEKLASINQYRSNLLGLKMFYDELVTGTKYMLVFCSGRGRPANLVTKCYFIHLSTIRDIVIRTRSKLHLVHALKSLRQN